MMSRPLSEGDLALKAMTRLLIERAGGLDAAAAATRVGRSQLANYYSPHHDQFAPVDVVARLEDIAQEPMVTEELLRRRGCVAVRPAGTTTGSTMADLAKLSAEMGELCRVAFEGMVDGHLSLDDKARIEREVQDVIRQASSLLGNLHARMAAAEAPTASVAHPAFRRA